jgi:hypothetical protein
MDEFYHIVNETHKGHENGTQMDDVHHINEKEQHLGIFFWDKIDKKFSTRMNL